MPDPLKAPSPVPPQEPDEVVHYDEAVIGRVFRWSGIAALVLLIAGIVGYAVLHRRPARQAPKLSPLSAPTPVPAPTVEIPTTRFTDITASSGINFKHINGAYGEKLLPETMGSGVAFFDFDND